MGVVTRGNWPAIGPYFERKAGTGCADQQTSVWKQSTKTREGAKIGGGRWLRETVETVDYVILIDGQEKSMSKSKPVYLVSIGYRYAQENTWKKSPIVAAVDGC